MKRFNASSEKPIKQKKTLHTCQNKKTCSILAEKQPSVQISDFPVMEDQNTEAELQKIRENWLKQLEVLHADGLITAEEYQLEKKRAQQKLKL